MSSDKISVLPLSLSDNIHLTPYLPLGMITAYLRVHRDGWLAERYDIDRIRIGGAAGHPMAPVFEAVEQANAPVCLLSLYIWNFEFNLQKARKMKRLRPDALVVVGGPEVPRMVGDTEAFLEANPFVDVAVLGEGEMACAELLEQLAESGSRDLSCLKAVDGIVFRWEGELVRTGVRQRLKDIGILPSPYLTGEFEPWFADWQSAILETNRGCPYGCTYCDWGSATLQKIAPFPIDRLVEEIALLGDNRVRNVFIADANFGVLAQDVEIARAFVATRERTGFPKTIASNFAKNGGRYLMEVIKILHRGGLLPAGIIALQTTDEEVLKVVRRNNIKTSAYERMMQFFNEEGIPMSSDIMVGLPGQTVGVLERDLQFCFDWKVSANAFNTSMMPNAPMAEPSYRKEHGIVVGPDRMIRSTRTFSAEDLDFMKALFYAYVFHVRYGVSRYYLYFLQNDYGVPAMRLVRRWLEAVIAEDPSMPLSNRVYRELFAMETRDRHWYMLTWGPEARFFFDDVEPFYAELHALARREFGVEVDESELRSVVAAQTAVMPRVDRRYPVETGVEHDVVGYFEQFRKIASLRLLEEPLRPLAEFQEGSLSVGQEDTRVESVAFGKIIAHADPGWEIESPMRF